MKNTGFTLLEGLFCLTILAILASLATPEMKRWKTANAVDIYADSLFRQMNLARQYALTSQRPILLCAADNKKRCSKSWSNHSILIFHDGNNNLQHDDDEIIFHRSMAASSELVIHWRSFGNKIYLRWQPTGLTQQQNGHINICPKSGDATQAKQIILNANGRAYYASDSNGDGVVENSQGENLQC